MSGIAFAQKGKEFLALHCSGTLGTLRSDGYPGGALVPYDLTPDGQIVIYIAGLTQHYKDLVANPRAVLVVADHFSTKNPQPYARASIYGEFRPVADSERKFISDRYQARFPMSKYYPHDFEYFICKPEKIYWNGGFASAGWMDIPTYETTPICEVSYRGLDALIHMNEDHADAVLTMAIALGGADERTNYAKMVSISASQVVVESMKEGKRTRLPISFDTPLSGPAMIRSAVVDLVKKARTTD